jgi:hypothetical protein
MKIIARRVTVALILAVHVAMDAFLISSVSLNNSTWTLPDIVTEFAFPALPIAQGCLIALWMATARMRFSLRLPLALLGTVAPLIVLLRLLGNIVSGPDAPAFTFMLITQLLTILILINGGRLVRRQLRLWRSGWTAVDARPLQFSLRQLLLWTAILAIILGIGKTVFGWLGWTADLFFDKEFYLYVLFAVYNAVYALLTLALFTVRVRRPVRILLFLLFVGSVGALACSMPLAYEWLFGIQSAPDVFESLMLAAAQIIYHTITLWPLWLCGYIGHRGHADTGPHKTTPASDNSFAQ